MEHIPVLLHEVIESLAPQQDGIYIDATIGDGGHSAAILQASAPKGRLLGLDQDDKQLAVAKEKLRDDAARVTLVCARFSNLKQVATSQGFTQVDGILFDLGISSRQLHDADYGLTFDDATPLDMRLSATLTTTASDFLNHSNEREIADVLYLYGDRHNSRSLARKIVDYRRHTALTQAGDIKKALGLQLPNHLAPIFQALRIWVNQEYQEIEQALPQALELLKPGGKLAVISFHSGEDRLVKHFMQANREVLEVEKFRSPSHEETKRNPRARSAKLRVAIKK